MIYLRLAISTALLAKPYPSHCDFLPPTHKNKNQQQTQNKKKLQNEISERSNDIENTFINIY